MANTKIQKNLTHLLRVLLFKDSSWPAAAWTRKPGSFEPDRPPAGGSASHSRFARRHSKDRFRYSDSRCVKESGKSNGKRSHYPCASSRNPARLDPPANISRLPAERIREER